MKRKWFGMGHTRQEATEKEWGPRGPGSKLMCLSGIENETLALAEISQVTTVPGESLELELGQGGCSDWMGWKLRTQRALLG